MTETQRSKLQVKIMFGSIAGVFGLGGMFLLALALATLTSITSLPLDGAATTIEAAGVQTVLGGVSLAVAAVMVLGFSFTSEFKL